MAHSLRCFSHSDGYDYIYLTPYLPLSANETVS